MTDVLTDEMRAEVRKAAQVATPSPWFQTGAPWFRSEDGVLAGSEDGNVGFLIADCEAIGQDRDEYEGDIQLARSENDAAHIVASQPANVLALLDALEATERERDEARKECERIPGFKRAVLDGRIAQQRRELARLTDELTALRDSTRAMAEALEPFADLIGEDDEDFTDETTVTTKFGRTTDYSLSMGDLRRAARVLADYRKTSEEGGAG